MSIKCVTFKDIRGVHIESTVHIGYKYYICNKNLITNEDAAEYFLKTSSKKAYLAANAFMVQQQKNYSFYEFFFINLTYASPIYEFFCREKQLNKVTRRLFEAELFSKHLKDELLQFY